MTVDINNLDRFREIDWMTPLLRSERGAKKVYHGMYSVMIYGPFTDLHYTTGKTISDSRTFLLSSDLKIISLSRAFF